MKDFLELIKKIILLIIILWALFSFLVGVKMVPDDDMEPRLSPGDILLYYRLDKSGSLRDVLVVKKNDTEYIGRVIAAGGDKVEITEDSILMVNDNMVVEQNIYYPTTYYEGFLEYPLILAEDEYFLLSDKREGGEDSRYYGPVKKEEILGTVICQYRRGGI